MLSLASAAREVRVGDAPALGETVFASAEPVVLRGLIAHWPAVHAGARSLSAGQAYLRDFYQNATVGAWFGPPEIGGRFFYNADLSGFNYRPAMVKLDAVFEAIARNENATAPEAVYVGSTTVDTCLPGFRQENDVLGLPADALASIWIGNRTRIAAHFDMPDNLACVAIGRRRFTLFPPDQLANLYVGPLEFTPAGQQISLVDFANPELERFPRFVEALRNAFVAELEPGDALFIPGMWWHHVEALDAFNVLVNYWWQRTPAYLGAPAGALMHALLSLRGLPPEQRAAWHRILEYYVFDTDNGAMAHVPEARRGVLGGIDERRARSLRALLLNQLNR
jgi:hypothetical protein